MTQPKSDSPSRRIEWRVALIGAAAALVGAIIGGAASLLTTIYQDHEMAAAQIQSERKSAYQSYNTAVQNLASTALGAEIYLKLNYPSSSWKTELNQFQTYLGSFYSAEDQVSLVASPRIYQYVQDQLHEAELIDLDLMELEFRETYPSPSYPAVPDKLTLLNAFMTDYAAFDTNTRQFQGLARQDLGAGLYVDIRVDGNVF